MQAAGGGEPRQHLAPVADEAGVEGIVAAHVRHQGGAAGRRILGQRRREAGDDRIGAQQGLPLLRQGRDFIVAGGHGAGQERRYPVVDLQLGVERPASRR